MHNAAFAHLGLDYAYVAFHVREIGPAIAGVRGFNLAGLSVTIPHKLAVMPHLDEISPLAQRIGAVNTITHDAGRLLGTNTDAHGSLRALEDQRAAAGQTILILGVGGAARAILLALACERQPAKIILAGRKAEKTQSLAQEVQANTRVPIEPCGFTPEALGPAVEQSSIIIHTTPVGMHPHVEDTPLPGEWIRSDHVVFDMIYNPLPTRLLREADQAGAQTISGLPMFVYQGAEQFRLWTGIEPPADVMQTAVLEALQAK